MSDRIKKKRKRDEGDENESEKDDDKDENAENEEKESTRGDEHNEKEDEDDGVENEFQKDPLRNKLFSLRMKINESQKLNRTEVVEDERRKKNPSWKENLVEKAIYYKKKEKLKKKGGYDPKEYLNENLFKVEFNEEKNEKKEKNKELLYRPSAFVNPLATEKAFRDRESKFHVDLEEYENEKKGLVRPRTAAEEAELAHKLRQTMEEEAAKKKRFHRKRTRNEDDEDIDYIHEENRRWNAKLEQAFGKYTAEIKENFERGTAL